MLFETGLEFVGDALFDGSHQFLSGDGDHHVVECRRGWAADVGVVISVAVFAVQIIRGVVRWPCLSAERCARRDDQGGDAVGGSIEFER